jgi:hypothetical protein
MLKTVMEDLSMHTATIPQPMRRFHRAGSGLVLCIAIAVAIFYLLPSHAKAAGIVGLSKAVRLPSDIPGPPDPFVINDTGEVLTAIPVKAQPIIVVAELSPHDTPTKRQIVRLPPHAHEATEAWLAFANDRQIALGTAYDDRAGDTTWRLGTTPPEITDLSSPTGELIAGPQVALDRRHRVVAVWTYRENQNEPTEIQAARPQGNHQAVETLYGGKDGILEVFSLQQYGETVDWALEDDNKPLGEESLIFADSITSGSGFGPVHATHVMRAIGSSMTEAGFATDNQGNQVFLTDGYRTPLWISYRPAGKSFGKPHQIAKGVAEDEVAVAAGGWGRMIVAWTTHNHVVAEAGNTRGKLGVPQMLGARLPSDVDVAVDDQGRAILAWDAVHRGRANGGHPYGVWVATAGPSGRFGRPVFVSKPRQNCELVGAGSAGTEPSLVQSANGHTLIFWRCGEPELETAYLDRYTP